MKKRVTAMILALTLMVGMLTGCMGQGYTMAVNVDGTCSYAVKYLYEQSMYQTLAASGDVSSSVLESGDFEKGTETIGGSTYLTYTRTFQFQNTEEMKAFLTNDTTYNNTMMKDSKNPSAYKTAGMTAPFVTLTLDATTFIGAMSEDQQLASSGQSTATDVSGASQDMEGYSSINEYYKAMGLIIDVSITLPAAITESNGTVSGNTATWNISTLPDDSKLIAVTAGNPITGDTVAPTITGAKNNGLYKKPVTLTASDDVNLKEFSVNGIRYNMTKLMVSQNGKYTATAVDANNNTTTIQFQIDTKKPKIKGIKSGKIYKKGVTLRFSDNVGVKSVKVNGKNANKKKVTLKKQGQYVVKVTDKAGNVTKVKFRIKK